MKYCKNCGAELSEGARYCPNCGIQTRGMGIAGVMGSIPESLRSSFFRIPESKKAEVLDRLDDDEEILYQRWDKKDLIGEYLDGIWFVAVLFAFFLICLFFVVFTLRTKDIGMFSIAVGSLLVLLLIVSYPLFKGLRHYLKAKRATGLTKTELRHYVEGGLLTTKRWIEKSYGVAKLDVSKYPTDKVLKERDILLIDKSYIFLRYSERKSYNIIEIEIFLDTLGKTEHPLKISSFLIPVEGFKMVLSEIEKKLEYRFEKGADGVGVFQFKSKEGGR